jgi:hypothetical protein
MRLLLVEPAQAVSVWSPGYSYFLPDECAVSASSLMVTTGEEAVTNPDRVEPGLVLLAYLSCLLAALFEVGIHFGLVPQAIADNCVNVGQPQGGVLVGNGFCRRPVSVGGYDCLERHACAADSYHAVYVRGNRY